MEKKKLSGLMIPAGVLIGIGVGMVLDQVAAGTLIGLGVGFVAMFVASVLMKEDVKKKK